MIEGVSASTSFQQLLQSQLVIVRLQYSPLKPNTDIWYIQQQSQDRELTWINFVFLMKRYGSSKAVEGTTSNWILSNDGSEREQVHFVSKDVCFKRCDKII